MPDIVLYPDFSRALFRIRLLKIEDADLAHVFFLRPQIAHEDISVRRVPAQLVRIL